MISLPSPEHDEHNEHSTVDIVTDSRAVSIAVPVVVVAFMLLVFIAVMGILYYTLTKVHRAHHVDSSHDDKIIV